MPSLYAQSSEPPEHGSEERIETLTHSSYSDFALKKRKRKKAVLHNMAAPGPYV